MSVCNSHRGLDRCGWCQFKSSLFFLFPTHKINSRLNLLWSISAATGIRTCTGSAANDVVVAVVLPRPVWTSVAGGVGYCCAAAAVGLGADRCPLDLSWQ